MNRVLKVSLGLPVKNCEEFQHSHNRALDQARTPEPRTPEPRTPCGCTAGAPEAGPGSGSYCRAHPGHEAGADSRNRVTATLPTHSAVPSTLPPMCTKCRKVALGAVTFQWRGPSTAAPAHLPAVRCHYVPCVADTTVHPSLSFNPHSPT